MSSTGYCDAGYTKNGKPKTGKKSSSNFKILCGNGIDPIDPNKSNIETQETFELCMSHCKQDDGCVGLAWEVDSHQCHLHNGELGAGYERDGWNAAVKKVKTPTASTSLDTANDAPQTLEVVGGVATSMSDIVGILTSMNGMIGSTSGGPSSGESPSVASASDTVPASSTSFLTSKTPFSNVSISTTSAHPTTNATHHDSGFSDMVSQHKGSIAGIMMGCIAGLALFASLIFLVRRHHKRRKASRFKLLSMRRVETATKSDNESISSPTSKTNQHHDHLTSPRMKSPESDSVVNPMSPGGYTPITAATLAALRRERKHDAKDLPGSTRMPVELPGNPRPNPSASKNNTLGWSMTDW